MLIETGHAFARAIVERPDDFPELRDVTKDRDRRRRSERLEAIGLVVIALMVRTDLLSLVVRWEGVGLPERTIARWTGLSMRRIRRAFFDLRWAGLVRGPGKFGPNRIKQPTEEFDPAETPAGRCMRKGCRACSRGLKHYRAKPAIRQITIELFAHVGRDGWLAEVQSLRWAALNAKPIRPMPESVARLNAASVRREARLLAGPSERPPPS